MASMQAVIKEGQRTDSGLEIRQGRPERVQGRSLAEIGVYDFLDELGIAYGRTDHEPAGTMEACSAVDAVLGITICKNLFLCNRQETAFYLLMMPGSKPFKTRELSAQIGSSRLSFGRAEQMERMLQTSPGSASIMGLIYDKNHEVRLLIDEDVVREPYIGCHPCANTSSLKIRTEDILQVFLPAVEHVPVFVHLNGE